MTTEEDARVDAYVDEQAQAFDEAVEVTRRARAVLIGTRALLVLVIARRLVGRMCCGFLRGKVADLDQEIAAIDQFLSDCYGGLGHRPVGFVD
jgi:hypothetical protein